MAGQTYNQNYTNIVFFEIPVLVGKQTAIWRRNRALRGYRTCFQHL